MINPWYLGAGLVILLVLYQSDPRLAGLFTVLLALYWANAVYGKGG